MKRKSYKLALKRETLRTLVDAELARVPGANNGLPSMTWGSTCVVVGHDGKEAPSNEVAKRSAHGRRDVARVGAHQMHCHFEALKNSRATFCAAEGHREEGRRSQKRVVTGSIRCRVRDIMSYLESS